MRLLAAVAVAALLPFAAGCGATGETGGAADLVPGDLALYIVVNTDFEDGQWETFEELAARFPGGENAIQRMFQALEDEGDVELDFEEDVLPALGPEVVAAFLELDSTSAAPPPMVLLTQPDDLAAFERLLTKSTEPVVTTEIDGWQAVALDQATLDRFQEGPRLSESEAFEHAMDDLPDDALAWIYMDGKALEAAGAGAGELSDPLFDALGGAGLIEGAAVAVAVEDEGGRIEGTTVLPEGAEETWFATDPFEAELPDTIPADAFVYLAFAQLDKSISGFRDVIAEVDPEAEADLATLEGFLGVSLEEDIAPLFAGESALYVRPGALFPEVTLVSQVEDAEQAAATLDELLANAGELYPLGTPQRSDVAGADVREVTLSPPVNLYYTGFDGLLVVTTSREGITALRGDGDRLAGDDGYRDALDQAGVPDETTGFGYIDLAEAVPLVYGYAELAPDDLSEARPYTDPLRTFVFFGTADDDVARFSFFLGIDDDNR